MLVTPNPRAGGEVENCTNWYRAQEYTSCEGFLALFGLTFDQFYAWNPAIGSDCTTMAAGTYYCVEVPGSGDSDTDPIPTTTDVPPPSTTSGGVVTPTPTQEGMVSGCTTFHQCVKGDGCWALSQEYGISLDDFYAWNPAVGTDCLGLWPDYYVCVGIAPASSRMRF